MGWIMATKDSINKVKNYSAKIELIRPVLLKYIRSRITNFHQAEDIAQDVLLILAQKKNEFDPNKSFYSWAFRICNFQIRAFLTKSKRNKVFYGEDPESMACGSLGYFYSKMPFQNLIQEEKESVKNQIMEVLTKKEKVVFSLSLKGWGQKDIMYHLKINRNVFQTTKSRALTKAKELFKNQSIKNYKA